MLSSAETVDIIAEAFRDHDVSTVVLDPVYSQEMMS
jgi:hydroxymethylpyrimidine/phosphomethylpyrimidine kinase